MTGLDIVFLITAFVTLVAAIQVVTVPKLVHAALWLVVTLFGVAVTFVLLNATFLAVVQVVVYVGAIAILMIIAIMLTRKMMTDRGPQLNKTWWLSALLGIALFVGLALILVNSGAGQIDLPSLASDIDPVSELGLALVSPQAYILPFELASILLLAALIGAIFVAWKK